MYYAIEHRYGRNTQDSDGHHIGTIHVFEREEDRDAWVEGGTAYANQQGNREALPASDKTVHKERRSAKRHGISLKQLATYHDAGRVEVDPLA